MRFGINLPFDRDRDVHAAGFDFLETNILHVLRLDLPDDRWTLPPVPKIPIYAAHSLVPPARKIVGPEASIQALRAHVHRTAERAAQLGIKMIVLDSPAALAVPEACDRKQARSQTLEFLRTALPFFARYDLMLVAGAHRPDESNVMTSLPEVLQYVWAVDHPHFQCLLDTTHFHDTNAPFEHVQDALPWIRHVHVTPDPRNASLLTALRQYKYDGAITLRPDAEAPPERLELELNRLKQQWGAA